ncbi:redoxin domain-containing protein [Daejeonella oryzae]|uniref:redoxin domain-containing protein n=1 Tax=Daejeonella oryzae TaxID=1122943 RepID=UPI00040BCE23|nr:redoxin domain-containing protein [Daejeonella oryzae]
MRLEIGQQAPEFKLVSSELKEVSLSDYTGRNLVIHFFPLAFTGTCTTQLCTMRDSFEDYQTIDADMIAVSIDSPFVLAKYKSENNYQFNLLSDFNKEVSPAYGAFYEDFIYGLKGVSKRAVFVLDSDHKIIYIEILEDANDLPSFTAIKECLIK